MIAASGDEPIETLRIGVDGRYRQQFPRGLLTFTSEISGGRDAADTVFTQLHQAEYLHQSRRWGISDTIPAILGGRPGLGRFDHR